jgi:axial budding pattern protein 2
MALGIILSIVLFIVNLAGGVPTIAFPLNSQVPPVARVSEPFSYTFLSSTFSSPLSISYALSTKAKWLSLDSSSRSLSGIPSPNDLGPDAITGIDIELTASDTSGSVTSNATIVVSRYPAPVIAISLPEQLPSFGSTFSTPSTLLYHPSTLFDFKFALGTFETMSANSNLTFYAVTADNTPLPAWISFDTSSLSFKGQTPDYASLIQSPQTFAMKLIASDVEGFGGTSIGFSIEVGVHLLAFKNAYLVMNATVGIESSFDGLSQNIELDGQPIDKKSLISVKVLQAPSWIRFDDSTLTISGKPPTDAKSTNVTVQAIDIYGDIANATVFINTGGPLFETTIESLNITKDSPFSLDLSIYLRDPSDISMTVELTPADIDWAAFNPHTFILSGQVASNIQLSQVGVTVRAISKTSQISDSQHFALFVSSGADHGTSSSLLLSSTQASSSTPGSQTGTSIANIAVGERLDKGTVVAIVLPLTLVMLLISIIIAFFCYRKRYHAARKRNYASQSDAASTPEVGSSVVEIAEAVPIAPPEPLTLDTSNFHGHRDSVSSVYTADINRRSSRINVDMDIRRSRNLSVMSGALMSDRRISLSGDRPRSCSESAFLKTGHSRVTTQESVFPATESRTNYSPRVKRNYSNYSIKGFTRRSGRVWPNDLTLPFRTSTQAVDRTVINLKDSSYSSTRVENCMNSTARRETNDTMPSMEAPSRGRTTRRDSKGITPMDRTRSGIGHGSRDFGSRIFGESPKRRSIGHGQYWAGSRGFTRNSRTWVTMNTSEFAQSHRSTSSNMTDSSEMQCRRSSSHMRNRSIHTAPKSASGVLLRMSEAKVNSRPIKRRMTGASPFFHGRSTSPASKRSSKMRVSYADSPTVPEEEMMSNFDNPPVGSPREQRIATGKLRSYLQSHMQRTTRSSMLSMESKASRFESASSSIQSVSQFQSPEHFERADTQGDIVEEEYEDLPVDDYTDDSWESNRSNRDSQPNVITYGSEDSRDLAMPLPFSNMSEPSLVPLSRSTPNSPMPDVDGEVRMFSGKGKKPRSMDSKGMGSVRGKVEGGSDDYTAYI